MGRLITSVLLFVAHCCAFATAPDPSVASQLSTVTRNAQITFSGNLRAAVTNLSVNGQAGTLYQDLTYAVPGLGLANGSNVFDIELSAASGLSQTNTVTAYLPASVAFVYDDNGNLTSDGLRSFEYDDLDRLTAVTISNAWRSEFAHDALGRRRTTKEFAWDNGWVLTNETRYVYSGRQGIQERDALNQVLVTYTLGQGLTPLARTTPPSTLNAQPSTAFYHADGNLNITALVNTEGFVQARYLYDPYGNLLAKSGPLADANLYRFSSKPIHPNSGLYYYGFRFYEPNLQRWMNQDPIGIRGGINIHGFVGNDPPNRIDLYGLEITYDYGVTSWLPTQSLGPVPYLYVTPDAAPLTPGSASEHFFTGAYNALPYAVNTLFGVMDMIGSAYDALADGSGWALEQMGASPTTAKDARNFAAVLGLFLPGKKCGPAAAEGTIPSRIYRGATRGNPNHVDDAAGVSFRDSLSNPADPSKAVLRPGRNYIEVDTSKLPPGSVVPDGGTVVDGQLMPVGHVSVYATPEQIVNATVGGRKFPK